MDFLPNHHVPFTPLLPHASPSKQPSHEPGYVSYPLFQSRLSSTSINEDKENQDVRFRGGVEAHSKGIFDVGDAMAIPRPVRIKQEYDDAEPLSRHKRKYSAHDTSTVSKRIKQDEDDANMEGLPFYGETEWPLLPNPFSKRIKKDEDDANMEEFPFYGETEWPLSKDALRAENSRPRVSLPQPNNSEQRDRQIPNWIKLAQAVNDARSQLQGEDLELFERLIARPRSAVESFEMIRSWRDGELKPRCWRDVVEERCPF